MLSLIYHFSVFHEIMDPGSGGEKNNWWELCTRWMDQAENISNPWPVLISYREKPPVLHRWSITSQWGFPAAAAAASLQPCPTLCDPIDASLQGSAVPGILQARTLEWVAISFSNAWKWSLSVMSDSVAPWTAAYQAPLSMGFSRQDYWSGVPLPSQEVSLRCGYC